MPSAVPEGYTSVTPYLIVHDGPAALAWYQRTLDAAVTVRLDNGDGRIAHAELRIGNAMIMVADDVPGSLARSPRVHGGSPVGFLLYVEDVDRTVERALNEGAVLKRPVLDQFYGDRSGTVEDPFGYVWTIATHIEDVAPEEMRRRMAALAKG